MEIPPYMSLSRAGALLGVPPTTVREWAFSGKLTWCTIAETRSGPVRKITRDSLRALMVSRGFGAEAIDGEPDLLTMEDVARLTGRATTTVFEWVKSGFLPSVVTRQDRIAGSKRNKLYRKVPRDVFETFRCQHARMLAIPSGRVRQPKPPKVKVRPPSLFAADRFISQSEAAKILRVSQAAITKWVSKGLIRSEEIPTSRRSVQASVRRIRREDFRAFVESGVRPKIGRRRKTPLDLVTGAA